MTDMINNFLRYLSVKVPDYEYPVLLLEQKEKFYKPYYITLPFYEDMLKAEEDAGSLLYPVPQERVKEVYNDNVKIKDFVQRTTLVRSRS